jgi:putative lipoprotein
MPAQRIAVAVMTIAMPFLVMAMGNKPEAAALDGSEWTLAELDGRTVDAGRAPTLRFDAGRVGGSDGCNLIGGTYTPGAGQALRIPGQRMTSTMMACEPAVMAQAAAYVAALHATERYRLEAGRLLLVDRQGATRAVLRAAQTRLAGSAWKLAELNNGGTAVTSVPPGTEITAAFGEDGQLSGQAGCNRYSGAYTADATTGRFQAGPLRTTRMHCAEPAGRMEQEALYLRALERGTTYRRSGDGLEIRSGDGALQVRFIPSARNGGRD